VKLLRQSFYLVLGLTFPGFWIFHAVGFWSMLYQPIQVISGSQATGWPSFITACLVYLAAVFIFEWSYRLLRNAHPKKFTSTFIYTRSSPSGKRGTRLRYTEGIIKELDRAQLRALANFYSSVAKPMDAPR
jgi:hypothetical protein